MENIFNQDLEPCGNSTMSNGSWDKEYKCSELGGGVHQICINNIKSNTPGFSINTGQSYWSDLRGTNNHCVCLGAWSLYNAKLNQYNSKLKKHKKNILKCEAIPKNAFSDEYISKFSTWNGREIKGQIIDGVEGIVNNCLDTKNKSSIKNKNLISNYCNFASNVPELKKNRKLYSNLCKNNKKN